jgi:hypothetical protein
MARYFFDIDDEERSMRDEEGNELPDLDAASIEALVLLPEMIAHMRPTRARTLTAVVREEGGGVVYQARLSLRGERVTRKR